MRKKILVLMPGILFALTLTFELLYDNHVILVALSLIITLIFYTIIFSLLQTVNHLKKIDVDDWNLSTRIPHKESIFSFFWNKINTLLECNEVNFSKISATASKLHDMSQMIHSDLETIKENKTIMNASDTMKNIIEDVNGQVAATEEISNTLTNFVEAIKDINREAYTTKTLAEKTLNNSKVGYENLNSNIEKFKVINNQMDIINEETAELKTYAKSIDEIVDLIKSISSQTNLLSFNAAVEAARAGNAGKGFAVVADEIRVLAQNATHSSSKISEILHNIINKIEVVDKSVDRTKSLVKEESVSILESKHLINDIIVNSNEVCTASDKTLEDLKEQSVSLEEIKIALEELSDKGANIFDKAEHQMAAINFLHEHLLESFNFSNELSNISGALKFLTKKYTYSSDSLEKNLEFVKWTPKNSVLVSKMDDEHKNLFEITNKIGNIVLNASDDKESLISIVEELLNYTKNHFKHEEDFLRDIAYNKKELDFQEGQHRIFINKIKEFKESIEIHNKKPSIEMIEFLRDWLLNHIDIEDKKYGREVTKA